MDILVNDQVLIINPNGKVIFLNELPDDLYKFFDLIYLDDRNLSE